MTYNKNIAYNDLPKLPPREELETKFILKKLGDAKAALAELRGWMMTQANPLLLLESITVQEAKASNEIENVVTTNDEIYQAMVLPETTKITPAVKEVLRYKTAMWSVYPNIVAGYPITLNVMIDLFRVVKERTDGIRTLPGTRLANKDKGTVYTPPDNYDDIIRLLTNLEWYINVDDSIDSLIKLAVIHYQFESIHPFPDGNGRVGRLLNVLYLVQRGYIKYPILYLSRYIIENKRNYYLNLQKVTEQREWEPWILYMLDAVEKTAKDTLTVVQTIYETQKNFAKKIQTDIPGIYSSELVSALFERPYCKINYLVEKGIGNHQTVSKYLRILQEHNYLACVKVGREKYFINVELLNILKG